MIRIVLIVLASFVLSSCATKPKGSFNTDSAPSVPDYSLLKSWAALPMQPDSADLVPGDSLRDIQETAKVDVFFIHPTTYTGKRGQNAWNASIDDEKLNLRTDKTSIKYQASLFNGAGRVYAPRYRQAHLESFYTRKHKDDARKALELAYTDVESAFTYYMEHYNEGRPLIIAAHSQGSWHGMLLLKEYFDGKPLSDKLVAAYLVGMAIKKEMFENLEPCLDSTQTACVCSWRTVKDGYYPKRWYEPNSDLIVTNPLTWSTNREHASRELNKGAVLKKFHNGPIPNFVDARVDDGFLMVTRLRIPGVPIVPFRNYHVADYNFYYVNVRENARQRVEAYFSSSP